MRLFDQRVKQFLAKNQFDLPVDMTPIVSERLDTSEKFSYHIAYPIVMPLEVVKRIATRLKGFSALRPGQVESTPIQRSLAAIDLQVYTTKTLRINGCLKFKNKVVDQTSMISSTASFQDTLVSYTHGYPEVSEPIALCKTNILNFNLETSRFTDNEHMP